MMIDTMAAKRILHSRIDAGAIPYAVIVSFLIVMLCGALILSSLLNNRLLDKEFVVANLNDRLDAGVCLISVIGNDLSNNSVETLLPFGDSCQSVKVIRKQWGAFDLYRMEASVGRQTLCRWAMFGELFDPIAVWLKQTNEYLYLVGKTKIVGDCYLPGGVVRSGRIGDVGVDGNADVAGHILKNDKEMPSVSLDLLRNIGLRSKDILEEDSLLPFEDGLFGQSLVNSFANKTVVVFSNTDINLHNLSLGGNIVVKSTGSVIIGATAALEDVIVVATSVRVADGFSGTLQVFAADSVIVGRGCKLKYPSFISCIGVRNPKIRMEDGAVLHGGLLQFNSGADNQHEASVTIAKGALVRGVVYTSSSLDVGGRIHGAAYCNDFYLTSGQTFYRNYLLDCEINSKLLDSTFVSPVLFGAGKRKGFIGWVN